MDLSLDRMIMDNNILDRLAELERQVADLQGASIQASELSELSDDLGVVRAGRFIAGEGDPDSGDLNGTAMMYPGYEIVIGENTYHMTILGMKNGVLQFGLSAEDGQALFAGGNAQIGADGIVINKLGYLIQHTATDGTTERTGSQGMWAEPGKTEPCYGFGLSSPAGTEMVTNGDAETGDLTGWTQTTDMGSDGWGIVADLVYEGLYAFVCGIPGVYSGYSKLTSDQISVSEKTNYKFSFELWVSTLTSVSTFTASVKWYNSSNTLLRTDTITKIATTSGYEYNEQSVSSPTGASYVVIEFNLNKTSSGPSAGIKLDDVSLSVVSVNAQLYFDSAGALKLNDYDLIPDGGIFSPVTMVGYKGDGTRMNTPLTLNTTNTKTGWQVQWGSGAEPTINSHYDAHVLLKAGTYTYRLYYGKAVSFGKLDLYVDGVKQNTNPIDLYASSASYDNEWIVTGVEVTYDGMHEIKLVAASKNASSSYYGMNASFFAFEKTD